MQITDGILNIKSSSNKKQDIETNIQVLTTGFWPTYTSYDIILPPELLQHQNQFIQYYNIKYQGRRLSWQYSLDRCILKVRFSRGIKELELSLFQTIVMLCFTKYDKLTIQQIRESTRLEDGELFRTLQSLACGITGTRVLTKEPKGKDVNESDVFLFNSEFTNKLFRIKINTIQLKDSVEEAELTHEEVFRDRQYQVIYICIIYYIYVICTYITYI